MQTDTPGAQPPSPDVDPGPWQTALFTSTWQTSLLVGVVTLALGLVVAFHPSTSINVIAVLLGVLLIVSGLFHVIRVFGRGEERRVWLGVAGVLLIVIGVVLIRHIHLTTAILGLLIGIVWIVQGLAWLMSGVSGRTVTGPGWWVFFGIVSLIAGIVVAASPVTSVTTLAVLTGIWFAIMGVFEIIGAFMLRHVNRRAHREMVNARHDSHAGA
jgi:uncharacterized membrane protein HdeD (DUF308 family)